MKNFAAITLLTVVSMMLAIGTLISSCSSEQPPIADMSAVDSTSVMTTQDSMRAIYDDLQGDFQEFKTKYWDINLYPHTNSTFGYTDSLDGQHVLEIHYGLPWAKLYFAGDSYTVLKVGNRFMVETRDAGAVLTDSLELRTPEEVRLALVPIRVGMTKALHYALRAQKEHKEKLNTMVATAEKLQ